MKIGIDARLWSESGVGRYIRNLTFNLSKIDKKNEYYIFLLKKNLGQNLPENFTEVEADIGWYGISEQIKFPKLLSKYKLDLVHFPHFNVPIFYSGKFVVTIHDLIHQKFEMRRATTLNPLIYKFKQFGYKKVFANALVKSEKIIAPSDFVGQELIELWKVKPKKVVVTYEGVDEKILKIKSQISKQKALENVRRLKVKPPFLFYVGNAHPHKNVAGLIKVFERVKREGERVKGLQLVLSGHDHYFWKRMKKENTYKDVVFTGSVTDEELVSLYKSAQVFVMPSFEEGFGIPILEAMACGCPVVSSNAASLPEVGGEACLYFDPKSTEDMANKIFQLLNDQKLRMQLIQKGNKRYKQFSWENLAKETLNVYREVI